MAPTDARDCTTACLNALLVATQPFYRMHCGIWYGRVDNVCVSTDTQPPGSSSPKSASTTRKPPKKETFECIDCGRESVGWVAICPSCRGRDTYAAHSHTTSRTSPTACSSSPLNSSTRQPLPRAAWVRLHRPSPTPHEAAGCLPPHHSAWPTSPPPPLTNHAPRCLASPAARWAACWEGGWCQAAWCCLAGSLASERARCSCNSPSCSHSQVLLVKGICV